MRLIAVALVSAALTYTAVAAAPDISGKWKMHSEIAVSESDSVCTFKQDGNKLSGNCKGMDGTVDLTGVVTDGDIHWSVQTEYNGTALTVVYHATLTNADALKGSIDVQPIDVHGTFTGTKL